MASSQDQSALDLIAQHLLTDFPSLETFVSTIHQSATSTLSQRKPSFATISVPTTAPVVREDDHRHYRGVRRRPWAARGYDKAAFKLRGSKAILNFPLVAGKHEDSGDDNNKKAVALKATRKRPVTEDENHGSNLISHKAAKREETEAQGEACPLTPSSWMGFWDGVDGIGMGLFCVPPLSPYPSLGHSKLGVN
ncbi:hypothetical protein Bca4012_010563 [Brassica carinata]|uniref:AP2/ERF domain-containing protein n=1 Tax=Brassica carinata TaxID=52824 RepID=A0A8X7S5F9_BRACI|nr:hypothetical protein Bca52824_035477 [Brassica carinata]